MASANRRIVIAVLVSAHLMTGLTAVYLTLGAPEDSMQCIFSFGLVVADASLFGIWFGLGKAIWQSRLGGIAIGILYTSFLFMVLRERYPPFTVQNWIRHALLMSSVMMFTAGPLLLLRRLRRDVEFIEDDHSSVDVAAFTFSLRHVLLLVVALGLLCSVVRVLHATSFPAFLLVFSISFAATTATVLWATMGIQKPVYGCPFAILAVSVNAVLLPYCFERTSAASLMAWAGVISLHALIVALSLLVVRWCGYRLLRTAPVLVPTAPSTAGLAD